MRGDVNLECDTLTRLFGIGCDTCKCLSNACNYAETVRFLITPISTGRFLFWKLYFDVVIITETIFVPCFATSFNMTFAGPVWIASTAKSVDFFNPSINSFLFLGVVIIVPSNVLFIGIQNDVLNGGGWLIIQTIGNLPIKYRITNRFVKSSILLIFKMN